MIFLLVWYQKCLIFSRKCMVSRFQSKIHYCHPAGGRHPLFTLTTCDMASPFVGVSLSPILLLLMLLLIFCHILADNLWDGDSFLLMLCWCGNYFLRTDCHATSSFVDVMLSSFVHTLETWRPFSETLKAKQYGAFSSPVIADNIRTWVLSSAVRKLVGQLTKWAKQYFEQYLRWANDAIWVIEQPPFGQSYIYCQHLQCT